VATSREATRATPARRCAYDVVRRVFEQGAFADRAFRAQADRHELTGRERAFSMRLAYGAVQRRATLDFLIERLTDRPIKRLDPALAAALRIGLYQVAYLDGVPEHAAVNETVELAKRRRRPGHQLVNAVMRRATREARAIVDSLGEATPAEAALRHSHPKWIAELWWHELGSEDAIALMRQNNEPPESAVRANTLRVTPAELASSLAADGARSRRDPAIPEALVLTSPYDVHGSPPFQRGALMPQSRASMLVARALDPQPGEQVLDLCAAPGAKATHIAALMRDEGRVVAIDIQAGRARTVENNSLRLGAQCVEVRTGDARESDHGGEFDRVLVDPPCSDLGTLQSRPDVRWRKRPAQVAGLAALQREILDAAAVSVRPGGRLVYSTCTVSAAENERQIEDFLGRHEAFSPVDLSGPYSQEPATGPSNRGRFLRTLPHRHGTDGFFIAALERHRR
jgi:16S rRNA (cytosine967-C5)-methyltransferase